jgi:hypothetical protein
VSTILLVMGVAAAWLLIAALLALAVGRAVAVARTRDEHRPPRTDVARASLARRTTTVVLGGAGRSR